MTSWRGTGGRECGRCGEPVCEPDRGVRPGSKSVAMSPRHEHVKETCGDPAPQPGHSSAQAVTKEPRRGTVQVVYERCCGLDVHKETVVACVLRPAADGRVQREVRTFSTMTASLRALSAWLHTQQVEQVAMESTGVYWWPVFNVLEEDGHAVLVVNPHEPIRQRRYLTAYRTTLVEEGVQEVNRLQKVLESANIKLAAVASDIL